MTTTVISRRLLAWDPPCHPNIREDYHITTDMPGALQDKFDELKGEGVFPKPEQVNINVECLNLSFLVKKNVWWASPCHFLWEVGQYSKAQPSLMPNVDGVLHDIAKRNYIIATDLLQYFYQIPLAHSSMKYCGVAISFKGIRVYTRSAKGMPGSKTCLEELMLSTRRSCSRGSCGKIC